LRQVIGLASVALGLVAGLSSIELGGSARAAEPSRHASRKADSSAEFIDRLIRESWDQAGVKPSRRASDEEVLRRGYPDGIGRIPTIQEASAFLRTRESGKRAKLVEYLLNHPDYAKHFANQWTILLIGRKRQERMVDREALTAWLRRQLTDNRP